MVAGEEGTVREFGMDKYTPLYLKRITSKDLPCGRGNSALWYVAAWLGGAFGGQWIPACVWLSPSCSCEAVTHS